MSGVLLSWQPICARLAPACAPANHTRYTALKPCPPPTPAPHGHHPNRCPGGQIVPTSTREDQLCINGMSFSRRNSEWANAALVVTVQPSDWAGYDAEHGPLAGVALQVCAHGGGGG